MLHIDTALSRGSVMLSAEGVPVSYMLNEQPHNHAAFVQPALHTLMQQAGIKATDVAAIAVSNGPGSYTGLRVGLASAKGLCMAWQIPLITLSTLQIMALAMQREAETSGSGASYYVPMIDARRMEVFCAVYAQDQMEQVVSPAAVILDETFQDALLQQHKVMFAGDGSSKWQHMCTSPNAVFISLPGTEAAFAQLAWKYYDLQTFANLAYAEPFYTKGFYSTAKPLKD